MVLNELMELHESHGLGALAEMKIEHPFLHWLWQAAVFLACCFGTVVLMQLLMSKYDCVLTLPFAFLALVSSVVFSWFALRRWRFVAPLRCVSELGICGGIGGLGLYILVGYAIAYLFTPHLGPIRTPEPNHAPNHSVGRTGASRPAQSVSVVQRLLAPAVDAGR